MPIAANRTKQRGDTLIEVLFAITVFSLVVVATLSLMNQGTAAARRSVEMTLVRDQIDAQAESLRFLHESYVAQYGPGVTYDLTGTTSPAEEYAKILNRARTANLKNATQFTDVASCPASTPSGGFIVNPRTALLETNAAKLVPAGGGYAQLEYAAGSGDADMTARGIWIEAVPTDRETNTASLTYNAGYVDYYIRACWDVPGRDTPLTMGTIVRLYEPRG